MLDSITAYDRLNWNQKVGLNIELTRQRSGLRQEDLARSLTQLGFPLTRNQISAIERGTVHVTAEQLEWIAQVLQVKSSELKPQIICN